MSPSKLDVPRSLTPLGVRSRTPSPNRDGRTLVFAYGSNLWRQQMAHRCPGAEYIGMARLRHWRWLINQRGYANIAETPPATKLNETSRWLGPLMSGGADSAREGNDRVYGLVYRLEASDEASLDRYEGVPSCYEKITLWVEFWGKREGADGSGQPVDVRNMRSQRVKVLVYVDKENTFSGEPVEGYGYKINAGIKDALAGGVPLSYVEQCIRPFVPVGDEHQSVAIAAVEDAVKMGIDVRSIVERAEKELCKTGVKQDGEMQDFKGQSEKHVEGKMKNETNGNGEVKEIDGGAGATLVHRGRALSVLN